MRSPVLRPLAALLTLAAALGIGPAPAGATSPLNLTPLSHIQDSGFLDAFFVHDNLLWYLKNDGRDLTVRCYDVNDPANPVHLSTIPLIANRGSNTIADMHGLYYSNGLLYAGVERAGGGFVVFDYSDPRNPTRVAPAPPAQVVAVPGGCHTLRLADGYLYVMSDSVAEADIFVYDVSDPANPVEVNRLDLRPGQSFCHDLSVMEGRGYASWWDDGMYLLDLSNPAGTISTITRAASGNNTHSAWPSADFSTVVTCHEANNEGVKFWDMTQTPPVQSGAYQSHEQSNNTVVHDVMVVGGYAYITYYRDGIRILDLSTSPPSEVGSYITDRGGCGPNDSFCSAIAQWVENGRLHALDMDNGAWIFDFALPNPAPITLYAVKRNAGRDVEMTWNHTGESQYTVRRGLAKQTVTGTRNVDVDGRLRWTDAGVVADGNLYYYRINGNWEGRP